MNRYQLDHRPASDISQALSKYEKALETIEELHHKITESLNQVPKMIEDGFWNLVRLNEGTFHIEKNAMGPCIFFLIDDGSLEPVGRIKITLTFSTIVSNPPPILAKIITDVIRNGHAKILIKRKKGEVNVRDYGKLLETSPVAQIYGDEESPKGYSLDE